MSQNFQRGDLVPALWQAQGGPLTTLNIQGHTLDLSVLLIDVTNSASLGIKARLASTLEGAGTFKLSFDLDIPFYGAMLLRPGIGGIASFGVNAAQTRFIQTPVSVEKVGVASAREGDVQLSVDVKINSLVGFFVYPPIP